MKKFLSFIFSQLKYFFINPFWTRAGILFFIVLALIGNGLIWYLYLTKFREMIVLTPIIYSSAVLFLNILLADISYQKQALFSYIFLGAGLLIQIFFILFILINSSMMVF